MKIFKFLMVVTIIGIFFGAGFGSSVCSEELIKNNPEYWHIAYIQGRVHEFRESELYYHLNVSGFAIGYTTDDGFYQQKLDYLSFILIKDDFHGFCNQFLILGMTIRVI